jgi:uncharacterized cysteine cluster protein YcgN (CxxCxxCC family)
LRKINRVMEVQIKNICYTSPYGRKIETRNLYDYKRLINNDTKYLKENQSDSIKMNNFVKIIKDNSQWKNLIIEVIKK